MTIKIVTDSTCDIPKELVETYQITVIPCYINLDGESYLDGVDITRQSFYQRLPKANPHPTTSAPGPGSFLNAYEELAAAGADGVFSIHVSKTFSNIFNSAEMAAEEIDVIPVKAIDSGNLTLGLGLIVLLAAKAAANGANFDEVAAIIDAAIQHTHSYAKLDTIDYLHRSGRMSAIQHSLISMLDIKPILKMNAGVSKMEIVRTKRRAYQRVHDTAVAQLPQAVLFGITHADAPAQAAQLMEELAEAHPELPAALLNETSPALGTHVGPGTVCVVWTNAAFRSTTAEKGLEKWIS
ncbi:MAG: DegV family protein [Anaerolineaceae bacterium]|jgi:DegV family protein with EDD domain|nr:DegV family protein [Anaerolineaceae bacterium]